MKSKSLTLTTLRLLASSLNVWAKRTFPFFCTYDLMVDKDLVGGAWWQDHITSFLFKRKDNFGLIELTFNPILNPQSNLIKFDSEKTDFKWF